MEKLPPQHGEDNDNLARLRAQVSRLVGSGKTPFAEQERAERRACLDRALDALSKAVAAGYPKVARLKKEASRDPFRSREDFQELLSEPEKKESEGRRRESEVIERRD
jgi:hypothetical protein